jgi:GntR family transcriptional regulator, arabinose operon transcriptional repressor
MNKVSDILLSDDSFISLYVQLHNQLRHLILSERWVSGSRIPSESQLTQHFNISRSTVRLALQQAEIEGLIERVAGRGTFVAHPPSKRLRERLIAFVACGFDAENYLFILNGAESEVRAHGYQIVFNNAHSHEEEIDILKGLRGEDVAGVLLWPHVHASWSQKQNAIPYQQLQLPIVLMDRQIYGLDCDCVTSDNYGGAKALMRHLLELGHQHIVFLSHHANELLPVMERYRAYGDVLREADLTPQPIWTIGKPEEEIGASDALRLAVDAGSPELQQIKEYMLSAEPRPTAIFAVNDYMAVMALGAMKLLNISVPDAVSVAGFDDSNIAVHLEVPLTTVAQDCFTMGKRAARRLIDRLEGYSGPTNCEIIPTELRVRSSTSVIERV